MEFFRDGDGTVPLVQGKGLSWGWWAGWRRWWGTTLSLSSSKRGPFPVPIDEVRGALAKLGPPWETLALAGAASGGQSQTIEPSKA